MIVQLKSSIWTLYQSKNIDKQTQDLLIIDVENFVGCLRRYQQHIVGWIRKLFSKLICIIDYFIRWRTHMWRATLLVNR